MTITVAVNVQSGAHTHSKAVVASHAAEEAIRFSFNPSGRPDVATLKALAAAFLTACDEALANVPDAGRELAVAKTHMQTASMWAVLGATKGATP